MLGDPEIATILSKSIVSLLLSSTLHSESKASKLETQRKMPIVAVFLHSHNYHIHSPRKTSLVLCAPSYNASTNIRTTQVILGRPERAMRRRPAAPKLAMLPQLRPHTGIDGKSSSLVVAAAGVPLPPLDLTEDNVRQVLADARVEASHL